MMFRLHHMIAAGCLALAAPATAAELSPEASEALLATGEIIQADILTEGERTAIFVVRAEGRVYACRTWVDVAKAAVKVSCWDSQ
ncbi:hypothetical protein LCL97_12640 [Seohaeicola saemankumensis]|nr:hypothetical protein [Seohaeicola saemankumensis]MCA0871678.1 hypothetical protein [Seohaeicola saemankumensis]